MKVSEAIDQLEVGDTVWVKGEVNYTNKAELFSICCDLATTSFWICDDDEISLTEPKNEKVEVPDFVAEWYEVNKGNLEFNIASAFHRIGRNTHNPQHSIYEWLNDSNNEPMQTLFKMKDGYTVKPKRWVVKSKDHIGLESFVINTIIPVWTTEEPLWMTFTDKAKAEAVATLVEGSVEEI